MRLVPKRRWFRFSLRMLFAAVTVLAIWLGWQVRWIHQRDEFQAWLKSQEEFAAAHEHEFVQSTGEHFSIPKPSRGHWLLWIFGKDEVKTLALTFVVDDLAELPPRRDEALVKAAELFPEAAIVVINVHHHAPQTASPGS